MPKAWKTCLWLLKIILPISLAVRLLQYSGLLAKVSVWFEPMFSHIGLPAESAVVFLTSIFSPLYAAIALIASMGLTVRQLTILALMCLIAHNLPVETSIQGHTGSRWWWVIVLRISSAFIVAFLVNQIMPYGSFDTVVRHYQTAESCQSIAEVIRLWLFSSLRLIGLILVIVTSLMVFHYLLEEFRLMDKISRPLSPLMRLFGLPADCSFLWLVGNLVGLAYGGAIMVEQIEANKLSRSEGDYLNHHLAISHSLLEDTLIFVALGVPLLWIVVPRLAFAFIVVWSKRFVSKYICRNV